ncbi:MAG: L,D-transpeptidase [Bacteroidales bacterium]
MGLTFIITTVVILFIQQELYAPTIRKELLYDKYTIADSYIYNKEQRSIHWNKIDSLLEMANTFERRNFLFGTLVNYKNRNGVAPVARDAKHDKFNNLRDSYGMLRYQSIPLYDEDDLTTPERYARDGTFVAILSSDTSQFVKVELPTIDGVWYVPRSYLYKIGPVTFRKAIFIDRKQQHIITLEQGNGEWLVRSQNPATTGQDRPPYKSATPLGVFVVQDKLQRMLYHRDGTKQIEGFAPFACRFTGGAYVHGFPVNNPEGEVIEYSPSLGTIPRSHMCVRNATSHAQFIYNWVDKYQALVFVYE